MTKILMYEGNSKVVSRTYETTTTLSAYSVTMTVTSGINSSTKLLEIEGVVDGDGVTFKIPTTTLEDGIYYFEVTGETATQKETFEQDRLLVKESIVYLT